MPPKSKSTRKFALIWWINSHKRDVVAASLIPQAKRVVGSIVNLTWKEFKTKEQTREQAKVLAISEGEHALNAIQVTDSGEISNPADKIFAAEVVKEKKIASQNQKLVKIAQRSQKKQVEQKIKKMKPIFDEENFAQNSGTGKKILSESCAESKSTLHQFAPPYVASQDPKLPNSSVKESTVAFSVANCSELAYSHPQSQGGSHFSDAKEVSVLHVQSTSTHFPPPHDYAQGLLQYKRPHEGMTVASQGASSSTLAYSHPQSQGGSNFSAAKTVNVTSTSTYFPPPHDYSQGLVHCNRPYEGTTAASQSAASSTLAYSHPQTQGTLAHLHGTGAMIPTVYYQPASLHVRSDVPRVLNLSDKAKTIASQAQHPQPQGAFDLSNESITAAPSIPTNSSPLHVATPTLQLLQKEDNDSTVISKTVSHFSEDSLPAVPPIAQGLTTPEILRSLDTNGIRSTVATNNEDTSQNPSQATQNMKNVALSTELISWQVTKRDIKFLEAILASAKNMLAEQQTKEVPTPDVIVPLSAEYFTAGIDKVEIFPKCGFYLAQDKYCYIKFKFDSEPNWKVLVRETLLAVYGSSISKYCATGIRGKRPAINYVLFRTLFDWVNKLSPRVVDRKTYVNFINKVTSNKRRRADQTSEQIRKRLKQSASTEQSTASPTRSSDEGEGDEEPDEPEGNEEPEADAEIDDDYDLTVI